VGVVDSEYVVHQSIQTLGGQSLKKVTLYVTYQRLQNLNPAHRKKAW